jgi:hypothetical protein
MSRDLTTVTKKTTNQSPLPINNDSIYVTDIDIKNSDNGDFISTDSNRGEAITDYFDSLKTVNTNITGDNPKILKFWFNRTIYSHAIGFGCDDLTKGFGQSITIKLLGSGEEVRQTIESPSGSENSRLVQFTGPAAFNGIILEFNTASEVCLSNLTIQKETDVAARLLFSDNERTVQNAGTRNPLPVIDLNGTAIARGDLKGYGNVQKFGHNESVGSSEVTIWHENGIYVHPTSASIMTVSSASGNDVGSLTSSGTATGGSLTTLINTGATFVTDGVVVNDLLVNDTKQVSSIVKSIDSEIQLTVENPFADGGTATVPFESGDSYRVITISGTGAAVVKTFGLDSNYDPISEYVILNGQTPVNTIKSFLRVNRMIVLKAGSNEKNVGVLYQGTGTITGGTPANIYTSIDSGDNQTLQAFYTVPRGKTAFLSNWFITIGTGREVEAKLFVRSFGEVFQVKQETHLYQTPFNFNFEVPILIREKSDIEVRAKITAGTAVAASSSFDLILIENE